MNNNTFCFVVPHFYSCFILSRQYCCNSWSEKCVIPNYRYGLKFGQEVFERLHITAQSCKCLSSTLDCIRSYHLFYKFVPKYVTLTPSIVYDLTCIKKAGFAYQKSTKHCFFKQQIGPVNLNNRDSMNGDWLPFVYLWFTKLQLRCYAKMLVSGYNSIDEWGWYVCIALWLSLIHICT